MKSEKFRELYIRFMVWLGVAPPADYEHLLLNRYSCVQTSAKGIIRLWGIASAIAVTVSLYVGSLVTGIIVDTIFKLYLGPDTDEGDFWFLCFGPFLFLTLFVTIGIIIQWFILQRNYKAGWKIFLMVFIGVFAIAECVSFAIGLRGIFLFAALGLVWWGVQSLKVFGLELARLAIIGMLIGGVSGAITGKLITD